MRWLITAFAPFEKASTNSSLIVAEGLKKRVASGFDFHMPVSVAYSQSWPEVEAVLESKPYDGVLALGQAGGRTRISLERVALNWIDSRTEDNLGVCPEQGRITTGPDMLWCPIPWQKFASQNHAHVFERSYSAGTFVCNHLMFHLVNWAQQNKKLAGFVHIPVLQSQVEPSLAGFPKLSDQIAIEAMGEVLNFLAES